MTFEEAQQGFYDEPTPLTASRYITEAVQKVHDDIPDDDDGNKIGFNISLPLVQASGEVAFWLKFGSIIKMPPPE